MALALTLAGTAYALVTDQNVGREQARGETYRGVTIDGTTIEKALIEKADISDAEIDQATLRDVSVAESHLMRTLVERASISDSRVVASTLRQVTLDDVTVCQVGGAVDAGTCWLVSSQGGRIVTHARLLEDAPASIAPGEHFDLRLDGRGASQLVVRNDPAGSTEFGFDATAADASVEKIELLVDGEAVDEFAMGEAVSLPDDRRVTLRVHAAEEGILDGSKLGLVLEVDGRGLRTAMTTFDVVATQLAFAPPEAQFNAPFVADAVGRLIVTLPTDEFGNVDRDIGVSLTLDVKEVEGQETTDLVREHLDTHGAVHGDSEFLFSENPIRYARPTSEIAHRPATLEMLLRDNVGVEGIEYGSANFHATHIVAIGPTETTIDYFATATNARGEVLTATTTVVMEPAAEDDFTVTLFKDFELPGRGQLLVEFVDEAGNAVEAPEGAKLRITETPMSHNISKEVRADGVTELEVLAASKLAGIPFGNFVASEYQVCLMHDGRTDCANDGDLVAIESGKTSVVQIELS